MLGNRNLLSKIEGNYAKTRAINGCPQGGILSPLLWIITINKLLHKLRKEMPMLVCQAFADDVCILATGIDYGIMIRNMKKGLEKVSQWCKKNGLKLNVNKTELIKFCNKRDIKPRFVFHGEEINAKPCVKYLGILVDTKLLWNKHIQYVAHRAKRLLPCSKAVLG